VEEDLMKLDRRVTVRGLIVPTEWDRHGSALRVSVFTFDDDEYEVAAQGAGRLLPGRAGEEVVVHGHLESGSRGRKVLNVMSFSVVDVDPAETQDLEGNLPPWA
jgi:cytochrome c-type biogenesis protein CcmE